MWLHAGRARLQRLRPSDFTAIGRDGGIVRHVLRLERQHLQASKRERPGKAGNHERLAHVGAGPLKHQNPGGHDQNSMPACAFTPALK